MTSTAPRSPDPLDDNSRSDEALLAAARRGSTGAYGVLYERHLPLALSVAGRNLVGADRRYVEDVANAGFIRVMSAIRNGRGPKDSMPAYLATAVRHEAWELSSKLRRSDCGEVAVAWPLATDVAEGPVGDPVELNRHALLAGAFRRLQPRWRYALWLARVEGRKAGEVAGLLGIESSVARALLHRARRGLVSAYVATYLEGADVGCNALSGEMTKFLQAGAAEDPPDEVKVHLAVCSGCRDLIRGIDVSPAKLAALGPTVLLPAAAAAALNAGSSVPGVRGTEPSSGILMAAVAAAATAIAMAAAVLGLGSGVDRQEVATTDSIVAPSGSSPSTAPDDQELNAATTTPPDPRSTLETPPVETEDLDDPPPEVRTTSPASTPTTDAGEPTTPSTTTTNTSSTTTPSTTTTTATTTTTVQVAPSTVVTGRVRDATAGPAVDMADTLVSFTWDDGRGTVQTTAGPDGRFVLDLEGAGRGTLTIWFPTPDGTVPFTVTTLSTGTPLIELGDLVFTRR